MLDPACAQMYECAGFPGLPWALPPQSLALRPLAEGKWTAGEVISDLAWGWGQARFSDGQLTQRCASCSLRNWFI